MLTDAFAFRSPNPRRVEYPHRTGGVVVHLRHETLLPWLAVNRLGVRIGRFPRRAEAHEALLCNAGVGP